MTLGLIVDQLGVFLVGFNLTGTCSVLQLGNRVRRPHVLFATCTESVLTASIKHRGQHGIVRECRFVQTNGFFSHLENTNTLDVGRRTRKVFLDEILLQTDRFKYLCAGVRHISGDAHLGHDLVQTLANCLDVVINILLGFFGIALSQRLNSFERQIGMHSFRTVAAKQREMMRLTRRAGFDYQTGTGAQTFLDQMLMNRRSRQQRRDGHVVSVDLTI